MNAVAAFVEAQRTKRAARAGDARIHDENLYRLLDGLLAARRGDAA